MSEELATKRVEVRFVGVPPTGRVERAQGVSDVVMDGSILRCLVCGSFQPLLDAVRGYEVVDLRAASIEHERKSTPQEDLSMTSPKTVARVAGSLYLFASLCFVFAMLVRSGIIKEGDSAGTADNIRSSASLFRASLAIDLVSWTCFLLAAMALYVLLQHVHRMAAAAMVVFVAVLVTVGYLNELNSYTVLTIATNADYPHAFGADASSALVTLFRDTHVNGIVIDEMFWGLWLVPLSYLVIKSRQFPRLVGVLLIVAAVNWIGQFAANLLAPGLPYVTAFGQVGGLGEIVFVAWLLIFGIKLPAAGAPASAIATSSGRG